MSTFIGSALLAALLSCSAFAKVQTSSVERASTADSLLGTLTSKLGPVVNLGYAAYAGNSTLPDVTFYGGIPYIKPPVGNLRFAPPQQLDETPNFLLNNDDVIDARNWGPLCIQQPAVVGIGNEDCVTLNIWTPSNATSTSKLPVYVYIHGGGHYYNSAQGFPANDWVARSGGGLIAVAVQYRLGLLGYLSSAEISKNPTSGPNNGLFDQRAALEWLQRHVAAFGGDPAKITIGGKRLTVIIAGESSPFRAAVIESSGLDPFYTTDHAEQCFGNVTKQVGCDGSSDVVACLRKASSMYLFRSVSSWVHAEHIPTSWGRLSLPSTTNPLPAINVPILAGHNAQDGSIFIGAPATIVTDTDIINTILKRYPLVSLTTMDAMLVTYPPASATTPWTTQWERAMYAYMESELACWDYFIGNVSGKPAFNYRWDAPDPNILAARGAYVGAAHTAELFYLYDGTNSGPSASVAQPVFTVFNPEQDALARQAVAWWSSFARTLDPNTFALPGSPTWLPASEGGFMVADLGVNSTVPNSGMVLRTDDYPKRCAWWRSVGTDLRL
ncbi:Alpha/Beta hydrolase protein [Mycena metata]|uniref:Alpha/Beta hydrolase protein n=1 Tax=Mycena metata TaxID=1033252 RepID=A0AAD7NEB7_9AGAR|nr:Alpha/Beta hydrolase protein [Mycena metata]